MSAGPWDKYAVCPCGWKRRAPFGKVSHIVINDHFMVVCPNCGADRAGMSIKTMRYVDTGRLFRPSTWDTGHWETQT